jgi:hypothetical protein
MRDVARAQGLPQTTVDEMTATIDLGDGRGGRLHHDRPAAAAARAVGTRIDEWGSRSGIPGETVAAMHDSATRVAAAEEELRAAGILGEGARRSPGTPDCRASPSLG